MASVRTLRFDDVADDDDGDAREVATSSDDEDDVGLPVVVGGRRARAAFGARAPRFERGGERRRGRRGRGADAEDVGGRSEDSSETIASRFGSETVLAVGRARQDAFERARNGEGESDGGEKDRVVGVGAVVGERTRGEGVGE